LTKNSPLASLAIPFALISTSRASVPVPVPVAQSPINLSMSVPSAVPVPIMPLLAHVSERDRIITPYDHAAFSRMLAEYNLSDVYSELPHKLKHGFPLGDLKPLTCTSISSNHPTASEHRADVLAYFEKETSLGRMSGPYSCSQIESKVGFFRSSPVQVDVVPGVDGNVDKKCICCNLSFKGPVGISVNDQLDSDDFPTRWGTASDVADIVSNVVPFVLPISCLLHSHIILFRPSHLISLIPFLPTLASFYSFSSAIIGVHSISFRPDCACS
jgi:hypothetical protein